MMRHSYVMKKVPKAIPSKTLPDGAVNGNGDVSLMMSGNPDCLRMYVSKSDFWKAEEGDRLTGGLSPLGIIEIRTPQLAYSDYRVEQFLDSGRIEGNFEAAHVKLKLNTCVCAVENTILIELEISRPASSLSAELLTIEKNGAVCEKVSLGDTQYITRSFADPGLAFETHGIMAMREISRKRLEKSELIRIAVTVGTNHDSAAYKRNTLERLSIIDNTGFERLKELHGRWWKKFWQKSGIEIHDKEIEKNWYAGLYILACCSRNKKFPPGLWGNFSTDDSMAWHSDYHLNYNYEAPYYALTSSNHIELMECYDAPLEDFLPYAKEYARKFLGCRGIYFPVGIGPLGMDTSKIDGTKEHGRVFLGQKSNASYAACIMAMRWYGTRDEVYAEEHAYPFMRELAFFWEDYLSYEDGRYVTRNDAIHEVEYYSDTEFMPKRHDEVNPIISIGMIKMVMRALLDMQSVLGFDPEYTAKWKDILENVGSVLTFEENGKHYLRATEEGMLFTGLVLQYMYPAGEIGSLSDKHLLDAAYNSFVRTDAWENDNLFCSYYPQAARLGVDPDLIIEKMKECIHNRELGNGLYSFGGGGIENNSAVPACINEMLMQSYEGVLRLFPNWNLKNDASFFGFRANGAFIVSAKLKDGVVNAEILSEKGGELIIEKPQGGDYYIEKHSRVIEFKDGRIKLNTSKGEIIVIKNK